MCGRRTIREIGGRVFIDSSCNGVMEDSCKGLRNIGISLYGVVEEEAGRDTDDAVRIRKEKRLSTVKTDENGYYSFLIRDRDCTVSLDAGTLPPGMGVAGDCRFYRAGDSGSMDFAVREVDSVRLSRRSVSMHIGEELRMDPEARDRKGRPLTANIEYWPEDDRLSFRGNVCSVAPRALKDTDSGVILQAGKASLRVPVRISVPGISSADRVRLAHRLGILDEHTKIRYLLYALCDGNGLPGDYRSAIPVKSGTGLVEEIKGYMERADADPKTAEAARRALASAVPKLDRAYRSPGGYFNIHYTLSGDDAVAARAGSPRSVPPYIEQIGRAFDEVRSFTCFSRGFREPVIEAGQSCFDVYVFDQKGKYGVTYSSVIHGKNSSGARTASGYICIDNSYSREKGFDKSREDCMKVTAAHEFFHAVQYAYNVDADGWWKEASATWNEDEVYTGVNDYLRYIPSYLSAPYKPLDESSYSGVIFAKFLSENYGGNMIKRIWEIQSAGAGNSVTAIDRALREGRDGRDLGYAFNRFSAYNINPSQYYEEGGLWKTSAAVQNTYSSYPVTLNHGRLNHLSSEYQLFRPDGSGTGNALRITVDGANEGRWGFKLQNKKKRDGKYTMVEISSRGSFDRAVITVGNFGDAYESCCLIPSNLEKDRDSLKYSYNVEVF